MHPFRFIRVRCAQIALICPLALSLPLLAGATVTVPLQPNRYFEIEDAIIEIEEDHTTAQCGGWNVNESVSTHIPVVTGAPGYDGIPLFNDVQIQSGKAWRIEQGGVDGTGLQFPDTAQGFTAACRPMGYSGADAAGASWELFPPFYKFNPLPCERPQANQWSPRIYRSPSQAETRDPYCLASSEHCALQDPFQAGVDWTCDALCEDMNRRWIKEEWETICCTVEESPGSSSSASYASKPGAPPSVGPITPTTQSWCPSDINLSVILRPMIAQVPLPGPSPSNPVVFVPIVSFMPVPSVLDNMMNCAPLASNPTYVNFISTLTSGSGYQNMLQNLLSSPPYVSLMQNLLSSLQFQNWIGQQYLNENFRACEQQAMQQAAYQQWLNSAITSPDYTGWIVQAILQAQYVEWLETQTGSDPTYGNDYASMINGVMGGTLYNNMSQNVMSSTNWASLSQNSLIDSQYQQCIQHAINNAQYSSMMQYMFTSLQYQNILQNFIQGSIYQNWINSITSNPIYQQICSDPLLKQCSSMTSNPTGPTVTCNKEMWIGQCYDTDTGPSPQPPTPAENCSPYWEKIQSYYCCTGHPVGSSFPNCKVCQGQACRTGEAVPTYTPTGTMGGSSSSSPSTPTSSGPPASYKSYYRRYQSYCARDPVPGVPLDDANRQVPVSCYGFWDPYDPKTTVTTGKLMCTFGTSYAYNTMTKMVQTQRSDFGQVEYGQNRPWPDPPSGEYNMPRISESASEAATWYQKLGGGFSLLKSAAVDLTTALLALDKTSYRAYVQLTPDEPLSDGRLTRAYGDSVTNEKPYDTVVVWWQELTTQMGIFFDLPNVQVILPATWTVSLDPLEEYIEKFDAYENRKADPSFEPINVQLVLGPDVLGDVIDFLTQSLVYVAEEPVPVIIPMANKIELETYKTAWITYCIDRIRELLARALEKELTEMRFAPQQKGKVLDAYKAIIDNTESCEVPDGTIRPEEKMEIETLVTKIATLLAQLDEYIQQIDTYRLLRTELPHLLTELLHRNGNIVASLAQWTEQNMAAYQAFVESVEHRQDLIGRWQGLQAFYRTIHDGTNYPFCLREGLDVASFSRTDPGGWFPGRPSLSGGLDAPPTANSPDSFPRFAAIRYNDIVIDLSDVEVTSMTTSIPTMKPIEIRLDETEMRPPSPQLNDGEIPELAALPPIPSILFDALDMLPTVTTSNDVPVISAFFPPSAPTIDEEIFGRTEEILLKMDHAYTNYWQSMIRFQCADTPECNAKCGGLCLSTISNSCCVVPGTDEDCIRWETDVCIHPEMDVRPRLQNACARPDIILREDTEIIGEARTPDFLDVHDCPREDWTCQVPKGQVQYDIYGRIIRQGNTTNSGVLDAMRGRMVDESLNSDFQYIDPDSVLLESLEVPPKTDLSPVPSP